MNAKNKSIILSFVPLIIIIIALSYIWLNPYLDYFSTQKQASFLIGQPVPPFKLKELMTNETFKSEQLNGHTSLLNVFRSNCNACQIEHEVLMLINNDYKVPIFGINYQEKDLTDARGWLNHEGNPYQKVGIDKWGQVVKNLGIYGTPETFIVDKFGRIRYRYVGALSISAWEGVLWPLVQQYEKE
jgi:cytochrome c biogenesis protein CcmG/thiol:disulfide interchange protein DsbE